MAKYLKVQTWSAFTVGGKPDPRWDKNLTKDNVIKGATAELVGQGRKSSTGTAPNNGTTRSTSLAWPMVATLSG